MDSLNGRLRCNGLILLFRRHLLAHLNWALVIIGGSRKLAPTEYQILLAQHTRAHE